MINNEISMIETKLHTQSRLYTTEELAIDELSQSTRGAEILDAIKNTEHDNGQSLFDNLPSPRTPPYQSPGDAKLLKPSESTSQLNYNAILILHALNQDVTRLSHLSKKIDDNSNSMEKKLRAIHKTHTKKHHRIAKKLKDEMSTSKIFWNAFSSALDNPHNMTHNNNNNNNGKYHQLIRQKLDMMKNLMTKLKESHSDECNFRDDIRKETQSEVSTDESTEEFEEGFLGTPPTS